VYKNSYDATIMKVSFTILFTFLSLVLIAQVVQPYRYEIELDNFEEPYQLLGGEENGLLLYKSLGSFESGFEQWQFIKLDTTLKEEWVAQYSFDRDHLFKGYDYHNGNYFFLFQETAKGSHDLLLVQLNEFTGDTVQHKIKNVVTLDLVAFEMNDDAALLGGYYNQEPVVLHYGINSKKTKILPGIFGEKTQLIQVKIDGDLVKVLVSARTFDKRNTLAIKTYDSQGNYLDNYTFKPEGDLGLIDGRVAVVGTQGSVVSGTYGARRSDYSRGLFIAQHKADEEEVMRYFNFADLDNFFNYMKVKRKARLDNKISRKKVKGKKVKFNYRLLVHEIIETEDEFIMLGEAYYPKYSSTGGVYYMNHAPGSAPNFASTAFAGYRYTHAVVIGFDKKGNKLWDNSFQIDDVLTFNLNQYVHADVIDDKVVLLYLYNDEIRSKTISGSDVLEGKSLNSVQMMFDDDVANKYGTSNIGGLEKWYGHYFLVHGVQKIKNLRDSGVKLNRRVFYVNKLIYSDNKPEIVDLSE